MFTRLYDGCFIEVTKIFSMLNHVYFRCYGINQTLFSLFLLLFTCDCVGIGVVNVWEFDERHWVASMLLVCGYKEESDCNAAVILNIVGVVGCKDTVNTSSPM